MRQNEFFEFIFLFISWYFSFLLNFYVGSSGVFPVDTFIHYDNGFRILLGEHPVKDYWIVHGFIIDYIQALFLKFLVIIGILTFTFLIFQFCLVLFTFYIFKLLELETKIAFLLSVCTASLAYPVSGTPFLDLHSSYFSLFGIYFAIIAILKNKSYFWFWCSFFLCIGFFLNKFLLRIQLFL